MANEGTSLRGMDNNFLFLCVLQVTLANESIVLYMCEGKYNIYFLNENNIFYAPVSVISARKPLKPPTRQWDLLGKRGFWVGK